MNSEAKQRRQASSSACAPLDVEVGLLLAGEAGVGQVLGRGAAADGDVESVVVKVRRDAKLEDARDTTEEAKKTNKNVFHQARAVVTVEGIDSQGQTITYRTRDDRKMMHVVQEKKLLDGLHVGDRIEVTLTRERAIAIDRVR